MFFPLPSIVPLRIASKRLIDNINNIHALEKPLYSEYFGIAGRVDCIAEYNGEVAIIDFKTSKKIKPEKWCRKLLRSRDCVCLYVL